MKRRCSSLVRVVMWAGVLTAVLSPGPAAFPGETREEPWVARAVSVQGTVQALRVGERQWQAVEFDDTFRPGDQLRVRDRSRADVALLDHSVLRLNAQTTLTFHAVKEERTGVVELLRGAAHFFSRGPRSLEVRTPFATAGIRGTEFFLRVEATQTLVTIFAGEVVAENPNGRLVLTSGQSAVAAAGSAPGLRVVARPREAVHWALYYPPVLYLRPEEFPAGPDWPGLVRHSIAAYLRGDLGAAFAHLERVPPDVRDPRVWAYRAHLLLAVGRVEEAQVEIARALQLDPNDPHALALHTIIAVVQNERDQALAVAQRAAAMAPDSATAHVARSYAQQAWFDLAGARGSLETAVQLDPTNALAWARLAELHASFGDLNKALNAAQQAVALEPHLARTQTVLGYAYLMQVKTEQAKEAFATAIALDQADPLPRLGLGLAKIRDSDLSGGRRELEIAASLDPNNALVRSYLGKAYSEEKRPNLDEREYAVAKELDPHDPTPWFYDALAKQTTNRPVEALQNLQQAIALNDHRAVYRSRLLLDADLAARSASLARIYSDLGFQQRALVEGWKSANADPTNFSAHRLLADAYAALPRHEIARVSELLQSQLLQPLHIAPVQPQLAESELFILSGAGPAEPSLNEFNPLFFRDRFALLVSGIAGGNATLGDELVHSAVWGRVSYSLSQFHYETDGFRANNDLRQDIYEAFVQVSLSYKTSAQVELRYKDFDRGDLPLRFDPDNFIPTLRQQDRLGSLRLGLRHAFTPRSDLIASVIYRSADFDSDVFPGFNVTTDEDGYLAEIQHLLRLQRFHLVTGIGNFNADRKDITEFSPFPRSVSETDIRHTNLYGYAHLNYPNNLTWTLGASGDFFDDGVVTRDQFNPKLGLTWNLLPTTTLRAAVFRVLKRVLISDQTVEPTHVAGFNQFFDDPDGTESWRYGIGLDQTFRTSLYGGIEFSRRELEVPFLTLPSFEDARADWDEDLWRAYLYWTPHYWLAFSAEYQYERFRRGPAPAFGVEGIAKARTHRIPLGIGFFHPLGFRARVKATYLAQTGEFEDRLGQIMPGEEQFVVVDAAIGYRLPKRWGLITVGVRNLFDKRFNFQDTDPSNPAVVPERLIFGRLTLSF